MTGLITIDLCGRLAEPMGPVVTAACAAPMAVKAVLAQIAEQSPALAEALARAPILVAIDEQLAALDNVIAPGQRLAVFPPVSGG